MVEVTQEDREAAATYMKLIGDGRWSQHGILSGGCDNTSLSQAFARHRQAGVQQGLDMAAGVAELHDIQGVIAAAIRKLGGDDVPG